MTAWTQNALPPNWYRIRTRILRRANNQCEAIRSGRRCIHPATEVDHIVPRFEDGPDTDDNLRALCRVCHGRKTSEDARRAKAAKTRRPQKRHPGWKS